MNHFLVISGNGRSGSNRLLDILDRSPTTVCRSEANAVNRGDLAGIGGTFFQSDLTPDRQKRLAQALHNARFFRSERDRPTPVAKHYYRPQWLAKRWELLLTKNKLRGAIARTPLLSNRDEWTQPAIYTDREALNQALLVLKLNQSPAWTVHWHDNSLQARIIHNIRNPQDFLTSWFNRFANNVGPAHFERHFPEFERVLQFFGRDDANRMREATTENLLERELWRWRYNNELMYTHMAGSDRALVLTYKEIDGDPLQSAERVYDFAGIPFSSNVSDRVTSMRNTLFADKHTQTVDTEVLKKLIETVLKDSPLHNIPHLF